MSAMKMLATSPAETVIRTWLAGMAAAELLTRERLYPKRIAEGKLSEDAAQADMAAWRAIATLFAEGSVETRLSWAELIHAAAIQFQALCRSCDADPADATKGERRDAVQGILARLEWHRERAMQRPTVEQGRAAA